MAVRSQRLWNVISATVADISAYTVPADRTALIKLLWIYNTTALGGVLNAAINISAVTAHHMVWTCPANSGVAIDTGFLVLNPGDVLHIAAGASGLRVTGFGALLLGAPS